MYMFQPHMWPFSGACLTKDILQKFQEPMYKCEIASFKIWSEMQFRTSLRGTYHTDNHFTHLLQYIILSTNV